MNNRNIKFTSTRLLQLQAMLLLIAGVAAPRTTFGAFVTFTNKAAFLAATSSTNLTGQYSNLGTLPNGVNGSFAAGTVTFSVVSPSVNLVCGRGNSDGTNFDWTPLLSGPDIAIGGPENLNAQLAFPTFSAGFDFVEPGSNGDPWSFGSSCPMADSTFAVTLKSGGMALGSFMFNAPDDVAAFIGVQSDVAFDRLEIRETVGGCDNEYFGQFYGGGVALSSTNASGLSIVQAVQVCWDSISNQVYQVEFSTALNSTNSGPWSVLGEPVHAISSQTCICDPVASGTRFYQVKQVQ